MSKKELHSSQRRKRACCQKKVIGWTTIFLQLVIPLQGTFSAVAHASYQNKKIIVPELYEKYQLQPGETASSVALKFHISQDVLATANKDRYSTEQLQLLSAGDTLLLPKAQPWYKSATKEQDKRQLAGQIKSLASVAAQPDADKAAMNFAKSAVSGEVNRSVESWLNQYGTARVALNMNDASSLNNSSADMLYPFFDSPSAMLFTQGGLRRGDDRTTVNIGLGARVFNQGWMYGFNTFLDNDITGNNRRIGIGGELGVDYLKLAANNYFRLTNWHQSHDFADYDERPANGFDLRAEGWLPIYPQLGATLMYESYRGDEVALFGKDKRQKDPWALSAGLNYTPVPLITLSTAHRQGRDGANDHQINLQMNYRLGESWASHLDSDRVRQSRSLTGSRYDLVERNNTIVLDYRKQELVKVSLPSRLKGLAVEPLTLTASTWSKYGVKQIVWDYAALVAAGGQVIKSDKESLTVKLPSYQYGANALRNQYAIGALAYDVKGNISKRAETLIEVMPGQVQFGDVTVTKDNAVANNSDSNEIEVILQDNGGQPLADIPIAFTVDGGAKLSDAALKSDKNGKATVKVSHSKAAEVTVTVVTEGKEKTVKTHFIADKTTARFDAENVKVVKNGAFADGGSPNTLSGQVVDAFGNPVPNVQVTIAAAEGVQLNGATASSLTLTTDAQGSFTVDLTSKKAEKSSVSAEVNGQKIALEVVFVADNGSATPSLTAQTDGSVADGKTPNVMQVKVVDVNDNPVPNLEVQVTAEQYITLQGQKWVTDAQGLILINLTSTKAHSGKVTIEVNGKQRSLESRFVADTATANIADMRLEKDGAVANGTDRNEIRLQVVDIHNNPVPGVSVALSSGNGATLTTQSPETDEKGELRVLLSNTRSGISPLQARLNGTEKHLDSRFISDMATAQVEQGSFTVLRDRAEAGKEANEVSVKVVDAHGNLVEGAEVTFAATNGAQVAASSAKSDANGVVKMKVNKADYGISQLTATLKNSLSGEVKFTAVSTLKANALDGSASYTFTDLNAGLPTTGMADASFDIVINEQPGEAANYSWQSNTSAVSVSSSGRVTLKSNPGQSPVVITMTDKLSGTVLTYSFSLVKWFTLHNTLVDFAGAQGLCKAENAAIASVTEISSGQDVRGSGSFFGEWGNFASKLGAVNGGLLWTDDGYHLHPDTGFHHTNNTEPEYYVACVK
ncbi:inverse autotransporter beta domain-containing protein [Pantoea osteomyelitidis]|uniref:Inverse autotransporter beta domain-containing protein n=1 Tax=Pantoea osteomyelitidis TaxID=3230026 RepID=A0ABW7PV56_9GAMM